MIGTGPVTQRRAQCRRAHVGWGAGHARTGIQQANGGFKWVLIAWLRVSKWAMVLSRRSTCSNSAVNLNR
jgi:hypothetical protein